jgi:hypothetical protein
MVRGKRDASMDLRSCPKEIRDCLLQGKAHTVKPFEGAPEAQEDRGRAPVYSRKQYS